MLNKNQNNFLIFFFFFYFFFIFLIFGAFSKSKKYEKSKTNSLFVIDKFNHNFDSVNKFLKINFSLFKNLNINLINLNFFIYNNSKVKLKIGILKLNKLNKNYNFYFDNKKFKKNRNNSNTLKFYFFNNIFITKNIFFLTKSNILVGNINKNYNFCFSSKKNIVKKKKIIFKKNKKKISNFNYINFIKNYKKSYKKIFFKIKKKSIFSLKNSYKNINLYINNFYIIKKIFYDFNLTLSFLYKKKINKNYSFSTILMYKFKSKIFNKDFFLKYHKNIEIKYFINEKKDIFEIYNKKNLIKKLNYLKYPSIFILGFSYEKIKKYLIYLNYYTENLFDKDNNYIKNKNYYNKFNENKYIFFFTRKKFKNFKISLGGVFKLNKNFLKLDKFKISINYVQIFYKYNNKILFLKNKNQIKDIYITSSFNYPFIKNKIYLNINIKIGSLIINNLNNNYYLKFKINFFT